MGNRKKTLSKKHPFVSVCTPTFNRRPFIPMAIQCFMHQTYPREKMEWIIIDDGTDPIGDLVAHLPFVRYFRYEQKMTLGQKRNLLNEKARGDILVYMDDDDYYPPQRVQHAVERLRDSKALCAGSSAMYIYFKHIDKMYQFGPYGQNHATAATFAFKRELLSQTRFDEQSSVAEEKKFLKDYTIPFVQLDSDKSIVVFSHNHNSFDKKELLEQLPNPHVHETSLTPKDIVKEPELLRFFMEEVDGLLEGYDPGRLEHKPDVQRQLAKMRKEREERIQAMQRQHQLQLEQQATLQKVHQLSDQTSVIQRLTQENQSLREQVAHLNQRMREIIASQIEARKQT